jgi:cell division protein FtsL
MQDQQTEHEPAKPLQAARERRRLAAVIYQLKPLQLGIIGGALISLLAVLYLNEVGLATQANQRLQQLAANQAQLQRTNQRLRQQQGTLQSPGYIINHAKQMGMVPEDPANVQTITITGPR